MQTWGISGPDWLVLYGVLVLAPFVLGFGWRLAQTVRPSVEAPNDLTVHHLAYLAGGKRRVAESTLARLLAAKRIRVSSKGLISVIPGEQVKDRAERAVLGLASRKRIHQVVAKLGPVTTRMNDELAGWGLAVPEKAVRTRKKGVALLSLAVLALGVVRLVTGLSNHRPVGWLVLELVGAGLLTIVAFRLRRRDAVLATSSGRRVLREAKAAQRGRTSSTGVSTGTSMVMAGAGAAGAVALGGMALYPDPAIHSALAYVPASFSGGGGGSSGGYSCSSSSSCGGGGSSCGSSCGGGGGCGG